MGWSETHFWGSKDAIVLTDWDDKGGEGVTADNTAIIHDVLRRNFPVTCDSRENSKKAF